MRSGWLVVVVLVSFVAGAIWTLCEVHDQVRSGLVTFAGEAWHLVHERRFQDGWYNEPR